MLSATAVALALIATDGGTHHSARLQYDMDRVEEIEGELLGIVWRNPHVGFTVSVERVDGQPEDWTIESIPITRLARVGVTREEFAEGSTVKVAGYPARVGARQLYALNLLLPGAREVLLDSPTPRWSRNTLGTGLDSTPGEAGADPSLGVFRVWSNDGTFLRTETRFLTDGSELAYPLTDAARAAQAEWDPLDPDNPFLTCAPKGMPLIMQQPNPIEFVDNGDQILLRIEEYDTVRRIWMTGSASEAGEPTRLGHSFGRWDGSTLIVETRDIDWPFFDQWGLRQSPAMTTVERFTLDEAGSRLDYELVVTDSWLFTEPVTLRKSWRWVPGDRVLPFNCTELP